MDRESAQNWLNRYVHAWLTYDPGEIAALFSEDVTYRYHPYDEPDVGREAVVAGWLERVSRMTLPPANPRHL